MPDIRLTCTHCNATIKSATPVPAGKKVRCPKCDEFFTAPAAGADGIQEQPTRKAGKSSSEFALTDGDDVIIKKKEPKKSNLVLILGLVGCGGLLLLTCVIGVPALFFLARVQHAQAIVQAEAAPMAIAMDVNNVKAAKAKDPGMKLGGPGKLKKDYDEVRLGDHIDLLEKRMGGRGVIGAQEIPMLTDRALGMTIGKNMRLFNVNVIRSWKDEETGDTLVIGLQEDVVGFKGLYTRVGAETRVVHQFNPKGAKK